MAEQGALAGTFVEPRGTIRSVIARTAVRGIVGAVIAEQAASDMAGSSPMSRGDIGYLGVTADAVILFKAKRGMFSPKATADVLASAPRTETAGATIQPARLGSVLEITFADGSPWTFDIPKIHLKGAREIAALLTPASGT